MLHLYSAHRAAITAAICLLVALLAATTASAQLPPDFYDTRVAGGLDFPIGITFDDVGQGYIWEKGGRVFVLDTTGQRLPQPLLDLSEEVTSWKDHGLNGFCLDNDFRTNGYFYLYYTVDLHHYWHYGTPDYHPDSTVVEQPTFGRITRYQADPATGFTTVVEGSRHVLVGEDIGSGVPILYEFHGLGAIVQGTDGTLLFSSGEGTGGLFIGIGNEPGDAFFPQAVAWGIVTPDQDLGSYRSQYLHSLCGKVLRIDAETGDGLPSNPYYDATAPRNPQSRVWAWGLRNPYRMVLRPNTGSHYAEDGAPGTLVVGDVGNGDWEELNILTTGGQNFGWPVMEGNWISWKYWIQAVPDNPLAPNPLNTCDKPFFNFRDLLARPSRYGAYLPANPCDPQQEIPASVNPAYASSPTLTWSNSRWNQPTRAAVQDWDIGNNPFDMLVDAPESPVESEHFDGYSSLAGVFYTGTSFPEAYQGKYFHFDFAGWIRVFHLDDTNALSKVDLFHEYAPDIIHLAQNPADGALYYINLANEVRKIAYGGNPAPVAVIDADRFHGPGPLTVAFSAAASYDPNHNALSYAWDFGDGQTSTAIAPTHTFSEIAEDGIRSFEVQLTVTDSLGASNTATRTVSLNNTPPQVEITSFRDGDQYPLGSTSLLRLAAHVTDAEHTDEQLTYAWRTFLHHNDHFHPDPVKFDRESYMLISPLGCEQEIYFFRIELTVTDPEGLATTVTQYVYPYCDAPFIDDVNLAAQVNETEIDLLLRMHFSQDVERVEIQRSHDYFHFEVIGELSTQGSIIDPSMHLFTDEAPLRGTNMYRAKVRTVDGAFVYSNLVSVAFPRSKDWRVYPNPARESLTFAIQEATTERVELELFNMAGQRYHHAGFAAVPGEAWEKLVLVGDLMPGVYSYRLVNGEVVYTGQVVIL